MLIEVKRDEHIQVFCDSHKKNTGEKNATGFHHHSAK